MDFVSSQTSSVATDAGYALPLTSSGRNCREIIQLSYRNVASDSAAIPYYMLLNAASGPGPEADGTFDVTTHDLFPLVAGPSGAVLATQGVNLQVWPSHAKTNLSGRCLIPPGWRLVVAYVDGNTSGEILHFCITKEC